MIEALSEAERAEALDGLPDWDYDEARDAITRSVVFADFVEAFGFMTQVGFAVDNFLAGARVTYPKLIATVAGRDVLSPGKRKSPQAR